MGTRRHRFKPSTLAPLALALGLVAPWVAAELEIIALKHGLVEDLIPVLRPLLEPGGSLTGMNGQLIVKTSPENLAEIERALTALDRAPKMLRISVTQDISAHSQARENALSGRVATGNVQARIPDPGARRGARITARDGDGNAVSYRSLSTNTSNERRNAHYVTGVEGQAAFIETGESIPYPYQSYRVDAYGNSIQQGIDFRDVRSGFYVTPRTHGDNVTLDIAPQLERADPRNRGTIDTRSVASTVSGRLGEWIPLGGLNETHKRSGSELLARTRRSGAEIYDVWVLVEEINP